MSTHDKKTLVFVCQERLRPNKTSSREIQQGFGSPRLQSRTFCTATPINHRLWHQILHPQSRVLGEMRKHTQKITMNSNGLWGGIDVSKQSLDNGRGDTVLLVVNRNHDREDLNIPWRMQSGMPRRVKAIFECRSYSLWMMNIWGEFCLLPTSRLPTGSIENQSIANQIVECCTN